MYTAYTKTKNKEIDTLHDLDSSGMRITATSPSLQNTFGNWQTRSDLLQSLMGKIFLDYSELGADERVAEIGDVCSLQRYSDVQIIIKVMMILKKFLLE